MNNEIEKQRAELIKQFDNAIAMGKELNVDSVEFNAKMSVQLKEPNRLTALTLIQLLLEGRFSKMDDGMLQAYQGIEGTGYYAEHDGFLITADYCNGETHFEVYREGGWDGPLQRCIIDNSHDGYLNQQLKGAISTTT